MRRITIAALLALVAGAAQAQEAPAVRVEGGRLAGALASSGAASGGAARDGVARYLGVPFAAPPVGDARWQAPRRAPRWAGVRRAAAFGARCMQLPLYRDMAFRSPPSSEDCLYLNVWAPAAQAGRAAKLPVLFYIHGGGFQAGDGSEKRYDGAALAARGMVVVTANHRLGVFGFLAHPELTAQGHKQGTGNFGLLDQAAALDWVRRNVAAFGGDPARITVAGESAGSMSVSALMASPLTRRHIAGAIGESGALIGLIAPMPLPAAEAQGAAFAMALGAPTLAALRALPADRLLAAQGAAAQRFSPTIDGRMLVEPVEATFAAGRQAKVPLIVGTNSQEADARAVLGNAAPTVANYRAALARLYGDQAEAVAARYPAADDAQVVAAATALASDRFLGWPSWRWFDLHRRSGAPTWLYEYRRVRPRALDDASGRPAPWGAVHSAEIEYALANLDTNPAYAWTDEDRSVSRVMSGYWAAFVTTGRPDAPGLPHWPAAPADGAAIMRQVIDVDTGPRPFVEQHRYVAMTPLLATPPR
jgi:para-nitrobenzyl esterase